MVLQEGPSEAVELHHCLEAREHQGIMMTMRTLSRMVRLQLLMMSKRMAMKRKRRPSRRLQLMRLCS